MAEKLAARASGMERAMAGAQERGLEGVARECISTSSWPEVARGVAFLRERGEQGDAGAWRALNTVRLARKEFDLAHPSFDPETFLLRQPAACAMLASLERAAGRGEREFVRVFAGIAGAGFDHALVAEGDSALAYRKSECMDFVFSAGFGIAGRKGWFGAFEQMVESAQEGELKALAAKKACGALKGALEGPLGAEERRALNPLYLRLAGLNNELVSRDCRRIASELEELLG
jgi:hypothetical protein